MKVRNIWPQPRGIPDLGIAVDSGAVFDAPAWFAPALAQVWFWQAEDDEAKAIVAGHPEWWDHPYVAELAVNGQKVAVKPKAIKASKDGE